MVRMSRPPRLLATVAVAACLGVAGLAWASERGFSFWDAEFMPQDQALEAAQRFVASALPPGLPIQEARARLRRASMVCARPRGPADPVDCDCSETIHLQGGVIGEDHWTVRLTPDEAGGLRSASLDHYIIGSGPPNP